MRLSLIIINLFICILIQSEQSIAQHDAFNQNILNDKICIKYCQSQDSENKSNSTAASQLKIGGFVQIRYLARENDNDSFDLRRFRFSLKSGIGEKINFKFQNEFAGSKPKLLDAEVAYTFNNLLRISAGQFKIPFSMENLTSSSKLVTLNWSQNVEALVARSKDIIGNQTGRDIGLKISGKLIKTQDNSFLEYAVGIFNGSGINTTDFNNHKDIIGRLVCFPMINLAIGGSFYKGKYTLSDNINKCLTRERFGAEFKFTSKRFLLLSEYIIGKDSTSQKAGWYLLAGSTIIPEILQFVLKYDKYDPDTKTSDNCTTICTIGLNLNFYEKSKIQINYEFKDEQYKKIINDSFYTQIQFDF